MPPTTKSRDHLFFQEHHEYFRIGHYIYRSPIHNSIGDDGYREGYRRVVPVTSLTVLSNLLKVRVSQ